GSGAKEGPCLPLNQSRGRRAVLIDLRLNSLHLDMKLPSSKQRGTVTADHRTNIRYSPLSASLSRPSRYLPKTPRSWTTPRPRSLVAGYAGRSPRYRRSELLAWLRRGKPRRQPRLASSF